MSRVLLILLLFSVAAFGQETPRHAVLGELVRNGGFENGFEYWTEEVNNNQGSYSITRCTTYRPDPGYAARIYKYMRFFARLTQAVEITTPGQVLFSVSAKLNATKGTAVNYHAYAAVILEYRDAADSALGRTWIMKKVGNLDPQNSPTQHYIITTSDLWEEYSFLLADELANLPGINPAEVARVGIYLESYGTGATG